MKKHGRKTAGVLCVLCTAALLAGCAGTGTGATQGDTSVQASSDAATVAESTAPEAATVEESAAPAEVPAENSVTDVMPAYAREEYTLVRNARDGKTVCYFGERTEELPGEEQEPFYANTTNGTVIRTSESAYRFKNGEITDLHISPNEFIAASPEADNILFFEAAQSPSPEVKGYGAAYLLRGEDRIPLFEADGSKLMVSGSWSPNGAYYIYSLYDTKEERYAVMLFDGSASEEITSDTSFFPVIKVSNDGHTAYFRSSGDAGSGEAELYSISDGEIRTLGPVLLSGYIFSYDGTDMIWQDNTGWKLSVAGNAPLALKGEYTYIAPVNTITQTHVQTVGADTFLNTFYYDPAAASVYRINAAGEAELCLERVSADYMLAEDAKTFLYISDGSL
ncbi:MAG: hypothetical protein IJR00_12355, partial [Lachnospiraceae bacterium]|nr:hypothetical protein [Lachnospiraceae bacterium]